MLTAGYRPVIAMGEVPFDQTVYLKAYYLSTDLPQRSALKLGFAPVQTLDNFYSLLFPGRLDRDLFVFLGDCPADQN